MEKRVYELHASLCSTMASPVRLEIIDHLRRSEKSVGELAELTGTSQANMSQHLNVLKQKGLVTIRKAGAVRLYRLAHPKILEAFDILRDILLEQLRRESELAADWTLTVK